MRLYRDKEKPNSIERSNWKERRNVSNDEIADETVLSKEVERQKTIITEYEHTIKLLKNENEKLRESCEETEGLRNELLKTKQQIAILEEKIKKANINGEIEGLNYKAYTNSSNSNVKELLSQNEYLRKEIRELEQKIENLSSFKVFILNKIRMTKLDMN